MSLVRNQLDLAQEHLWVVYPRTRDTKQDLHVQIVGVWEPERLSKPDAEEAETTEAAETVLDTNLDDDALSPGYQDDYFSIRGEIVFHSAEEECIAVKIQQSPRKNSDKAKAFKLRLEGSLASPKLLGYFWDIQVERRGTALYIQSGSPIGLIPPKKSQLLITTAIAAHLVATSAMPAPVAGHVPLECRVLHQLGATPYPSQSNELNQVVAKGS